MTLEILLLLALGSLVASVAVGFRMARTWLFFTVLGAIGALGASLCVIGGEDWEWRSTWALGGQPVHLRLDGLSALFLVLVSVVGGLGAIYSTEYWSEKHCPSARRGRLWWSLLLLSMGLVLTVSNGLHFLIVWEIFAICGYFLIVLDNERPAVRSAGWLYLAASHAGTMCLFAFFAALANRTGSWDLGPSLREQAGLAPLFWLALFGFGMKAGFFPLHIWLPSAHANAPSHVSAIMSGVAIKMGLYGIIRFSGWLPTPAGAAWVMTALGAISALLGIAFAFTQDDFKRLLAYCSVENMGIMLTGVGAALLAVTHGDYPWGRLVLAGALLHVWNHGAFKSLLFFGAGSVLHSTGTREMSRLGGLWRSMPWTAAFFGIGCVAVSGLPPLNGFVSEWLVYLGLFNTAVSKGTAAWAAIPAVILLAMAGAFAMASFAKAWSMIFAGAPRTHIADHGHECGPLMRGPMWALAVICVGIGLAPVLFWPAVVRAIGSWRPVWSGTELPEALFNLNATLATLAAVLLILAALLWRKANAGGLRRGLTWDCGYAAPSARMQYTSASFAGIAAGWFGWILQPERKLRKPHGPFPEEAFRLERVPETVLERFIGPVGAVIMYVSSAARRLQHGRLQYYILYALVGLVAVGILELLGGVQ